MADPVTAFTAGAILKLAFDEFIKSSTGEITKKLTGDALAKANDLREAIWNYFIEKKNQKATDTISDLEKTGSEKAFGRLEVHLETAMDSDRLFADRLRLFSQEIEVLRKVKMVLVDGADLKESLEVEGSIQEVEPGNGNIDMTMLKDVKAQSMKLKDTKQKA